MGLPHVGPHTSAPKIGVYNCFSNIPVNTEHFYNICTTSAQLFRRWSNIIQMLYKCFVFTGNRFSTSFRSPHILMTRVTSLVTDMERPRLRMELKFFSARSARCSASSIICWALRYLFMVIVTTSSCNIQLNPPSVILGLSYSTIEHLGVLTPRGRYIG